MVSKNWGRTGRKLQVETKVLDEEIVQPKDLKKKKKKKKITKSESIKS